MFSVELMEKHIKKTEEYLFVHGGGLFDEQRINLENQLAIMRVLLIIVNKRG